ncbi:MAG TPA: cation:proton antiporter [Bryobacteraceae bacterium]|nr:cation:proton antiporter [Bryobacteraceae bacterium]
MPFAFALTAEHPTLTLPVSMLLVFGSAKLLAELFERLKQPGIVGEILAGVVVGPSVLGWIGPNENISFLGELGILFLLFRVGLEVRVQELKQVGRTGALVGVLGVAVPFIAGWALLRVWGKPQIEALFVGAALTATSVGITAQVLSTEGLLNRTASKIILTAAVIDDVLALLVLGVVSSVAGGSVNVVELAMTTAFAVGFILLIGGWGGHAARKVLPPLRERLRIGESQFALAMILLFGLAALSEKAGVAPIIGAFLAGMAMGEALPHRIHELAHGITELLVPFFLAGIGLRFNLQAFSSRSTLLLAAMVLVTAIVSKVFGCGLGTLSYGRAVALRVGFGMIPRGEFCMVVVQAGMALRAIQADTYGVVVFMAVTATLLTPPLLKLAFRGVERHRADTELSVG